MSMINCSKEKRHTASNAGKTVTIFIHTVLLYFFKLLSFKCFIGFLHKFFTAIHYFCPPKVCFFMMHFPFHYIIWFKMVNNIFLFITISTLSSNTKNNSLSESESCFEQKNVYAKHIKMSPIHLFTVVLISR